MSEADKMFINLGYKKAEIFKGYITYRKALKGGYKEITFDLEHKLLHIDTADAEKYLPIIPTVLSLQEMEIINKKIEELKWN